MSGMPTDQGLFLTALDQMTDSILLVDAESRLVYLNPAACDLFNLRRDESLRPFSDLFQNWPELVKIVTDPQINPQSPFEMNIGENHTYDVQITKHPKGTLIAMHDVTRFRQRNALGEEFVHSLSHNLRSPLTAILGYMDLIDRVGEVNETQREFIQRVLVSAKYINSLLNDLLILATCESSEEMHTEIVPIHQIIHERIEASHKEIQQNSLSLTVDIPTEGTAVLGNPSQLRILIDKLLDNAIRYSSTGGQIEIHCYQESGAVWLQIRDTGIGIPAGEQDQIFERFYRGSKIYNQIPGTGLGLAIAQAIVQNHAGQILVESAPGKGSTFSVIFPQA